MKKIYYIFLSVLMCCTLGACNNNTTGQDNLNDNNVIDIFADVAKEVTYIVHVSVNPEFEIHVNEAGIIVELKCLNEDAEKIFANVNVVGMEHFIIVFY